MTESLLVCRYGKKRAVNRLFIRLAESNLYALVFPLLQLIRTTCIQRGNGSNPVHTWLSMQNLTNASLVLIGMRGAGKSTLGEAVASKLGRKFVDVDYYLEGQWGHKVIEVCVHVALFGLWMCFHIFLWMLQ